jgi:hypothetical protein
VSTLFLAICEVAGGKARSPDPNILCPVAEPLMTAGDGPGEDRGEFLESLMATELYSIGALFCDEHPDLVDELVERSEEIQRSGLDAYARAGGVAVEEAFETLLTGLAVRYYKAVAG